MGSTLSIVIAIVVTAIAAGLVGYAIYFTVTNKPPAPGPTGLPQGQTMNMFFKNERTVPIWIIPIYGSATDDHVPRWTDWPFVSGNTGPVIVPHTPELVPTEIQPNDTAEMSIYTAGMASVSFIVRVNCQKPSMICELGDSKFVPFLDAAGNTQTNLYRGTVPFKPAIDTRVEMTWGCAYADQSLCGVNPSCITSANTCPGMTGLMSTYTGAVWHSDGLLYGPTGANIKLPYTNPGDTGSEGVGALGRRTVFDISCADGFTVPITLQIRRPQSSVGVSGTYCKVQYSPTAPAIDSAALSDWQPLASTRNVRIANCPTDEILWPTHLNNVTAIPGTSPLTDGFNTGTVVFPGPKSQYTMPWLTRGMVPGGTPTGTPPVKLSSAFQAGATTDLTYYRDPVEVAALPNSGFTVNDKIGCASTCSALVQNSGVSMLYPKGATGHQFATGTYLLDPVLGKLETSDRGVSDICCDITNISIPGILPSPAFNTSIYWVQNGATGPAADTASVINYTSGYFANVYAPDSESPWYVQGPTGPLSRNPYTGVGDMSKYVLEVRGTGSTGQNPNTRAYTYQYDDVYSTVNCTSNSAQNLQSSNGRGEFYGEYQVMMVVHDGQ